MKNDISSVMGKLSGLELGKLKAKDYLGLLTGIIPTYSEDDFDNAINIQDSKNRSRFFDYGHLSKELMIICLNYRIIVDHIEKLSFKLAWFRLFVSNVEMIETSHKLLTIERLDKHYGDDPGKHETALRGMFIAIRDELLDSKEEISKLYDTLKYGITQYFSCKDLIKGLSERLNLPELEAVISDDPLYSVELLNLWAIELPKDNPCKELFQAIDIEELRNKRTVNIKEKIDLLMTWLE